MIFKIFLKLCVSLSASVYADLCLQLDLHLKVLLAACADIIFGLYLAIKAK